MKMLRYAFVWLVSLALVACGGGGGNAGGSLFGGGTGTGTGTGGSPATGDSVNITVDVRNASGTSISKMGSAETVKVLAAVSTVSGSPVEGVVVAFAESGASLLKFAPSSKTALTNAQGLAEVEVSASDPTLTGATLITAKATGVTIVTPGQKAIEITAGGSSPVIPQPNAINFVQIGRAHV